MKRRELVKSGLLAGVSSLLPASRGIYRDSKKLTILITGAHPDDPESGCGGIASRFIKQGNSLKILYFTKGEAGITGKSHEEAALIRQKEAKEACKILGAEGYFFGQIDGNTFVNTEEYEKMKNILEDISPDIVFTQWPIDTHPDHRHLSILVYGTWLNMDRSFPLYYYEVMTGQQTQTFSPTDFVDITEFEATKRRACYAHESQEPDDFYKDHIQMSLFRGLQCGHTHAEAFIRQAQDLKELM